MSVKRRGVLVAIAVATVLNGVLISLAVTPATSERHWPGPFDWLRLHPWSALIALTACGVILAVSAGLHSDDARSRIDFRVAADELADALRSDWEYEIARWQVLDPFALPVRWVAADPDIVVSWSDVVKLAISTPGVSSSASGWASGPNELAGRDNDLADVLDRVPTRRLVVLGGPGTGKTILLVRLVMELLERRERGDPVPVLLPLASWNPATEDLRSWIAHWLSTARPDLARPAVPGSQVSLARKLLDNGLISPILDGLDEVADHLRGRAIAQINVAMQGRGLVLATRVDAYRATVQAERDAETRLTGAAGIELCPLDPTEATSYLKASAGGRMAAARWDPVISAFAGNRLPPASQALTTPLMVAMARTLYNPREWEDVRVLSVNPSELLDTKLFPTKEAVEDYLYESFIQASYRPHPNPEHSSREHRWTAEQATRWLTFLACNLEYRQNGTSDLMWWKLPSAVPRHFVGLTLALGLGAVAAIGYPFPGFGLGILSGLAVGLTVRKFFPAKKVGITRGLIGGLVGGAFSGLVALAVLGPGVKNNFVGAFIAGGFGIGFAVAPLSMVGPCFAGGLAGGITVSFYEKSSAFLAVRTAVGSGSHLVNGLGIGVAIFLAVELAGRTTPARGLRWSPLWSVGGAACGLVVGYIEWAQSGWVAGLVSGLATTVVGTLAGAVGQAVPMELTHAANPTAVLKRDRFTFLVSCIGLGVALGLTTGFGSSQSLNPSGQPNGVGIDLKIGLTNLVVVGIGFAFVQAAWGQFALVQWWLALRRRLPWRLSKFLQDACSNRGVLRQFGAAYQFRHIELQRRLAKSTSASE